MARFTITQWTQTNNLRKTYKLTQNKVSNREKQSKNSPGVKPPKVFYVHLKDCFWLCEILHRTISLLLLSDTRISKICHGPLHLTQTHKVPIGFEKKSTRV